MEFSKTIRKRMIDLDLSLADLPGASKSSWSKWIRDPQSARLEMISFLLRYLKFTEDEQRTIFENLIRSEHETSLHQPVRSRL